MVGGVSAFPQPLPSKTLLPNTPPSIHLPCLLSSYSLFPSRSLSSTIPILNRRVCCVSPLLQADGYSSSRFRIKCNSSSSPGGPGSGENESRTILDAFFLGKAVAEALTERIESTVGEVLSTIGRLQAEQQKQVQEFQEEVFERAKKAKEKAAREAVEEEGLVQTSTTENPSTVANSSTSTTSSSGNYTVTVLSNPSSTANVNGPVTSGDEEATDKDALPGVSTDE